MDVVRTPNDYSITMTQGTPAISAPFGDAVRERIADALGIAHEEICRNIPLRLLPPAIPRSWFLFIQMNCFMDFSRICRS